uniref:GPI mannosyltransferase 4 n=1 Tax=Lygus hesperus TaxID=30085 RepID=A0A0A9XKR7_LYGHE
MSESRPFTPPLDSTVSDTKAGNKSKPKMNVLNQNQDTVGKVHLHMTQEGERLINPKASEEYKEMQDSSKGSGDNEERTNAIETEEMTLRRERSFVDILCCRKNQE